MYRQRVKDYFKKRWELFNFLFFFMTINKLSSNLSPSAIVTIFVTDYPVQRGLDPSHQLTESDIYESHLPEQIVNGKTLLEN